MSWTVLLDPRVERFLKKQDSNIEKLLRNKLLKLTQPLNHIDSYHGEYYKFRLGDYRALLTLDYGKKEVLVHVLDKRSKIYKKK